MSDEATTRSLAEIQRALGRIEGQQTAQTKLLSDHLLMDERTHTEIRALAEIAHKEAIEARGTARRAVWGLSLVTACFTFVASWLKWGGTS